MQKSLMLMPYEQMVGAFGRRVFKEMRASFFDYSPVIAPVLYG